MGKEGLITFPYVIYKCQREKNLRSLLNESLVEEPKTQPKRKKKLVQRPPFSMVQQFSARDCPLTD